MIGNSIYGFLNDVTIGNGTVYNFIDYIGEIHVSPGIQTYSKMNKFMEANIFNNYDGGKNGRYGYGRYTTSPWGNVRGEFGVERIYGFRDDKIYGTDGVKYENGSLVAANLTQDSIGEYYTVNPTDTNSTMHFMSEYEFGDMSQLIRNSVLKLNIRSDIFKNRYIGDFDKFVASGMSTSSDVGDEIVDTSFRNEYQRFYLTRKPLKEASIINRDNLLKYRSDRQYHEELGFTGLLYGDSIDFPHITEINWGKRDLLLHYADTIQKVVSKTLSGYPYGVKRETISIYNIDNENTYRGTSLDSKISEGQLVTPRNGRINYSYIGEYERGSQQSIIGGGTSTPNNFVATTSNMSNASRLLQKTNELFKNNKIGSLINRFHTTPIANSTDDYPSDLISSYDETYGMSRGRNLLKGNNDVDNSTGYQNPYCRVWTAAHQYSKMKDLIRPFRTPGYETIDGVQRGLGKFRPDGGAEHLYNNTVLQDSGFVRITSQHNNGGEFEFNASTNGSNNLARYMFSIENLAWKGSSEFNTLPIDQRGPNGGRIMWFPPYNLTFNENINVSWRDNEFIGRGEKIYTYTNTERSGNLDFTILIDHPSAIDRWKGSGGIAKDGGIDGLSKNEAEQDILRFFAGCSPEPILNGDLNNLEQEPEEETIEEVEPSKEPVMEKIDIKTVAYYMFFPNNFSGSDYIKKGNTNEFIDIMKSTPGYEFSTNGTQFTIEDKAYEPQKLRPENEINKSLFAINANIGFKNHWDEIKSLIGSKITGINEFDQDEDNNSFQQLLGLSKSIQGGTTGIFGLSTKEYEIDSIDVYGFASSHGYTPLNKELFTNRQNAMIQVIQTLTNNAFDSDKFVTENNTYEIPVHGLDVNTLESKIARSAVAVFHVKLKENIKPQNTSDNEGTQAINGSVENPIDATPEQQMEYVSVKTYQKPTTNVSDEYLYFSKIEESNEFVYKNIVDKIRFFDPAFHSITPEGFNGRLSFLQQCTRQGPTKGRNTGGSAWNLAFGMQPYCVLRIGDFFHTKICITSVSVQYDNDGIHWDLNPEGAGVQPMMAKVSLSFNFVGGQDLGGPVNELQNAISENYYANTSIFNKRAKKIKG